MNNIQKAYLDIRLGNKSLEVKEYAKYLGIYIDSKVTWKNKYKLLILNCKKNRYNNDNAALLTREAT